MYTYYEILISNVVFFHFILHLIGLMKIVIIEIEYKRSLKKEKIHDVERDELNDTIKRDELNDTIKIIKFSNKSKEFIRNQFFDFGDEFITYTRLFILNSVKYRGTKPLTDFKSLYNITSIEYSSNDKIRAIELAYEQGLRGMLCVQQNNRKRKKNKVEHSRTQSKLKEDRLINRQHLRAVSQSTEYNKMPKGIRYHNFKENQVNTRQNISSINKLNERKKMTKNLRYYILQRDNSRCQRCGRTVADGVTLEVDHKIPISKGGLTEESNLWTLCRDCNRGKSDKYIEI